MVHLCCENLAEDLKECCEIFSVRENLGIFMYSENPSLRILELENSPKEKVLENVFLLKIPLNLETKLNFVNLLQGKE